MISAADQRSDNSYWLQPYVVGCNCVKLILEKTYQKERLKLEEIAMNIISVCPYKSSAHIIGPLCLPIYKYYISL
jgi:hypothetical protein